MPWILPALIVMSAAAVLGGHYLCAFTAVAPNVCVVVEIIFAWQTLITGALAVIAAAITIGQMRASDTNQERRHRELVAVSFRVQYAKEFAEFASHKRLIDEKAPWVKERVLALLLALQRGDPLSRAAVSEAFHYFQEMVEALGKVHLLWQLLPASARPDLDRVRWDAFRAAKQNSWESLFGEIDIDMRRIDGTIDVADNARAEALTHLERVRREVANVSQFIDRMHDLLLDERNLLFGR